MIDRIVIKDYRIFRALDMQPARGMNIIVGDNEAGKSTLLEAIGMALTCRVNGRWARDELSPHWFNRAMVEEFFDGRDAGKEAAAPEISIELFFTKEEDALQLMCGVNNSLREPAPGLRVHIKPAREYAEELEAYWNSQNRPRIVPVEYYDVEWVDFADQQVKRRPKDLAVSVIDSRTIRSTSGIDFHTREILTGLVEPRERAAISVAHRHARHQITEATLTKVNDRIAQETGDLHDRSIGFQVDQSSSTTWETGIIPQVDDIPFAMAGQGQQAAIKVALAMKRSASRAGFVLVEEPENHLSHTSLAKLIARIGDLAGDRQVFLTTHSSYVLNRLGVDNLRLLHAGHASRFADLPEETVKYFKRLSGYDTLRLVLARSVVLVEGPSDEMVFERAFRDKFGVAPIAKGIDIISMQGVALERALQLCAALGRRAAALRDNDDKDPEHWRAPLERYLEAGQRELFIGAPALGATLEPQLLNANDEAELRAVLAYAGKKTTLDWMTDNKTEAALRIAESTTNISYPKYIADAIEFIA